MKKNSSSLKKLPWTIWKNGDGEVGVKDNEGNSILTCEKSFESEQVAIFIAASVNAIFKCVDMDKELLGE